MQYLALIKRLLANFSDSIGPCFPSNIGMLSLSNLLNGQPCYTSRGASPLKSVMAAMNCLAISWNIWATSEVALVLMPCDDPTPPSSITLQCVKI
jgi:hypothetical protein